MTTDRKQNLVTMAIGLLLFLYGSFAATAGSWQRDWSFRGGIACIVVALFRRIRERQRTGVGQG